MKKHKKLEDKMSNVVNIKKEVEMIEDKPISYQEAADILGMKYNTAYNLIKYTDKITKYVYGPRNVRVSRNSTIAFRDRFKVVGEY